MIIIDTNVLSELMKPADRRAAVVMDWMRVQVPQSIYVTTITLAEVLAGLAILPEGPRKKTMQAVGEKLFARLFAGRILSFDEPAARHYATIITNRRLRAQHNAPLDVQIAAIAKARGMAVATRHVADFEDAGIELINPWSP